MRFEVICLAILAFSLSIPVAVGQAERLLTDFTGPDAADPWITVNDGVMGGRSEGGFTVSESGSTLLFRGETSLENNGGFSSIRMQTGGVSLEGFDGIAVRLKGDGRSYKLSLGTSARARGWRVAYWADFEAAAGEWQTVRIPFESFKPTSFGYELKGPALDTSDIRQVGFMLYDKKAGAFALEVDRIAAYGGAAAATLAKATDEKQDAESRTIVDIAAGAGTFETLIAAVGAAGLESVLRSEGPFTVLAPTDEAFGKLANGTIAMLLQPENRPKLEAVLKNHVFAGKVTARDALGAGTAKTLAGETLAFRLEDGRFLVGAAGVLKNDIKADNGIIHVIDTVLVPAELPASLPLDRLPLLLEHAVRRGVDLFNGGEAAGCRRVYEIALMSLLAVGEDRIGGEVRRTIVEALRTQQRQSDSDAAWTLRRAIDKTLKTLGS